MGALAATSSWIPEDDIKLKNAMEDGASLEALAKGAVHFSRRFTVRELQDRWHSLLYDPIVSAEASAHMVEFDYSASNLPSKSSRPVNAKEYKCDSTKRKAESVRSCYYAMRKRICNEPFNSMDRSYIVAPGDNSCPANGDGLLSANCVLGDPIANHFELQQSNPDVMHTSFPQVVMDSLAASSVGDISHAFHTGLEGDFPVEQDNMHKGTHIYGEKLSLIGDCSGFEGMGRTKEMSVCGLFEANDFEGKPQINFDQVDGNSGNMCSGFDGSQVYNSPISDCGAPFHSLGYSSPLPEMPIWRTIEGVSAPAMPVDVGLTEKDHCTGDAFALPDEGDANKTSTSGYNVVHSHSELESQVPCGECPIGTEGYFEELSNSLLNFTNEEELLFMDDEKAVIDKSYYDGFSLLLNSPSDLNQDQLPNISEYEASVAPDSYHLVSDGSCPGELKSDGGSQYIDGHIVCGSALNSQYPELRDGVICCTLNTEDPEIPCNDDIILPSEMPSSSLCSIAEHNFCEAKNSTSSIVKDLSDNQKPSDRARSVVNKVRKNTGQSNVSSQVIGQKVLPEMGLNPPQVIGQKVLPETGLNPHIGGCGVGFELSKSDSSHLMSRRAGIACEGSSQTTSVNVSTNSFLPKKVKEETTEIELAKHLSYNSTASFPEKPSHVSDGFKCYPQTSANCSKQEVDAVVTIQNNQALRAELGSINMVVPETAVNLSASGQDEQAFESDNDIPHFSDVEAMILDQDLCPEDYDFDFHSEVSRYQHEDSKKAIIRLEQSARSHMHRVIEHHEAFAVLHGRHSKYYIKKPEVLLGRGTGDVTVDIDLGREAHASKISRRQAIIKLDKNGMFCLKNLGKHPIIVNDKEVTSRQSLILNPSCYIEIRGVSFGFEPNPARVKQHIESITSSGTNQTQKHNV